MRPICNGKLNFIKAGNKTFPKAIATPIRKVPAIKRKMEPAERIKIPTVSRQREMKRVNSMPYFFEIFGAIGEMSANAKSGMVVRNPASTFVIPSPSRIGAMIGPTDVKGDRRVDAIKMMPIINNHVFFPKFSFLV